ncbi:LysR family transcriptional regulator [Marinomonas sp. 15G1-11]|uniref:LysR family transcriptional regulator n=1 Tax=Marinomonas phaeophyticola TaxID=3004091 RepID=A0ABT4JP45_9GAMM|nr:LysR family transcriptional regulator [Marinomonas sp. 15G1-11]MCZ2720140.1 LysR family transcriptional regulator [Marinomonas sp. 15G1-11]
MLSLEQVNMLVLSAELGSFSACARKLGKVQSAVSHGISSLELDLGVELFDRSSRRPTLTPEGERLIRTAKALLAQSYEFEKIAESIMRHEESVLTIAIDDALLMPNIASVLKQFSLQFPYVELDLVSTASPDIIHSVANGNVDIGVMFSEIEANKKVDFCYVGGIDFIAVCHSSFPLAGQRVFSESDLAPFRQIAVRGALKKESQALISMTPSVWWCSSNYSVLELVKQQIGWAYLPLYLVQPLIENGSICKIDAAFDHKPWSIPVDLVSKKGAHRGPAYQYFFETCKHAFSL